MKPWLLGNTTVRSPFRLRDGLVALSTSSLQGDLRGVEQDKAFRLLLGEHGIVELGQDETNSVGRKWRSALSKLGFLYPEIPTRCGIEQNTVGPVDTITPNGWRLVKATTVPAMQECFLRALAAHFIPSAVERGYNFPPFSPLRHTLSIMLELEKQTGESRLNFIEMALVVQLSSPELGVENIVKNILKLRSARLASPNKRGFDTTEYKKAGETHDYAPNTFKDYADTNLRYIKASGLVQGKGRGISLVPEKHLFIEELTKDTQPPATDFDYFKTIADGAKLPTDNLSSATLVLNDLLTQLQNRGIPFSTSGRATDTPADIEVIRHDIEGLLSEANEITYASQQASQWEEIAGYMELLITRGNKKTLSNGEEIEVPQSEAPAYFEWTMWRAFLAINSLTNKPYEARRFKVDQDFLPVGTAPGGGPDLIFEFNDFVIVVEVTLTANSRQEAAEGEPVRRHVADLVTHYHQQSQKPVYGLFVANKIDSNTAETFRIGVWYTNTDERMKLDIVPITLVQFKDIFEAIFQSDRIDPELIRELLDQCGNLREYQAPDWKLEINSLVGKTVGLISQLH